MMNVPGWLTRTATGFERGSRIRRSVVERNMGRFAAFIRGMLTANEHAIRKGLLQSIDPRAKIAALALTVASLSMVGAIDHLLWFALAVAALAWCSAIELREVIKRALPALIFTSIAAFPYALDYFSPGAMLYSLDIGGYVTLTITEPGALAVERLVLRVLLMASFVTLFFLSTKDTDIFKGLNGLPLPAFMVSSLFLALRYSFVLLRIAEDFNLARKSRVIRPWRAGAGARWFAMSAAHLFGRSMSMATGVAQAMCSRGFDGELRTRENGALRKRDYAVIGAAFFLFFMSFTL